MNGEGHRRLTQKRDWYSHHYIADEIGWWTDVGNFCGIKKDSWPYYNGSHTSNWK